MKRDAWGACVVIMVASACGTNVAQPINPGQPLLPDTVDGSDAKPDLDRGLAQLARVLKPGGRFVAVTNAADHLRELWELAHQASSAGNFSFNSENAEESLRHHFASVERRDARGWTTMDEDTIRGFAASWTDMGALVTAGPFDEPLRVRRHSTVFVAETA